MICIILFLSAGFGALICLAACGAAKLPTPSIFSKFSARRNEGETESDAIHRLLIQSPKHQAQMQSPENWGRE